MSALNFNSRQRAFQRIDRPEAISELAWIQLYGLICVDKWNTKKKLAVRLGEGMKCSIDPSICEIINSIPRLVCHEMFSQVVKPECFENSEWETFFELITKNESSPSELAGRVKRELGVQLDYETQKIIEGLPWVLMKEEIMSHGNNGICSLLADKYGVKLPPSTCTLNIGRWNGGSSSNKTASKAGIIPNNQLNVEGSEVAGFSSPLANDENTKNASAGRKHSAENRLSVEFASKGPTKEPRTSEYQLNHNRGAPLPPRESSLPHTRPQGSAGRSVHNLSRHHRTVADGDIPLSRSESPCNPISQSDNRYEDHTVDTRIMTSHMHTPLDVNPAGAKTNVSFHGVVKDLQTMGQEYDAAAAALSPQSGSIDLVQGTESTDYRFWKQKYLKEKIYAAERDLLLAQAQEHTFFFKDRDPSHFMTMDQLNKTILEHDERARKQEIKIIDQQKNIKELETRVREQHIKIEEQDMEIKAYDEKTIGIATELESKSTRLEKQQKSLDLAKSIYSQLRRMGDLNEKLEGEKAALSNQVSNLLGHSTKDPGYFSGISDSDIGRVHEPNVDFHGTTFGDELPVEEPPLKPARIDSGYGSGITSQALKEWEETFASKVSDGLERQSHLTTTSLPKGTPLGFLTETELRGDLNENFHSGCTDAG